MKQPSFLETFFVSISIKNFMLEPFLIENIKLVIQKFTKSKLITITYACFNSKISSQIHNNIFLYYFRLSAFLIKTSNIF